MQYNFAKSLQVLMDQKSNILHTLYKKSAEIKRLEAIVKKYLDPALAAHCHVANLNQNTLVIAADNAAWGTKLRYTIPDLLSTLRTEGGLPGLGSIQSLVQAEVEEVKVKPKTITLSAKAAEKISQEASTIKDPYLKTAMLRLSKNFRNVE